jgi:hypothetical protein
MSVLEKDVAHGVRSGEQEKITNFWPEIPIQVKQSEQNCCGEEMNLNCAMSQDIYKTYLSVGVT